jgi:hypothetical protein
MDGDTRIDVAATHRLAVFGIKTGSVEIGTRETRLTLMGNQSATSAVVFTLSYCVVIVLLLMLFFIYLKSIF